MSVRRKYQEEGTNLKMIRSDPNQKCSKNAKNSLYGIALLRSQDIASKTQTKTGGTK